MRMHQKKYRGEYFILLKPFLVDEALKTGFLDTLIYSGKEPFPFEKTYEVSNEVMDKLTLGKSVPYIGIAKQRDIPLKDIQRVILLDDLQDPANIGKLMATAMAFDFDLFIASRTSADVTLSKALEASKGAYFHLPLIRHDLLNSIEILKSHGFKVYATGLHGQNYYLDDVPEALKIAVVLGNEGSGVSEAVMRSCDGTIKIPMENIDSLNVAMAGAIVMRKFYPRS